MRIAISACLCAATLASAAEGPFNGSFELGVIGQAAPGVYLRQWFAVSALPAGGGPAHLPITAGDGSGGRCVRVPGAPGRLEYNLTSERFSLDRDGEVEFSFRLRCAAAEDGTWTPEQPVTVDLRAFDGRVLQWKPAAERYPVLKSFQVKADRAWATHSRRIVVRGGFPYALMFRCAARPGTTLNALEVDDIAVRYVDAHGAATGDEAVAVPDRVLPVYAPGDEAVLSLRARLGGTDGPVNVTATLVDDHSGAAVASRELALVPQPDAADAGGRRLCTADWALRLPRFGSFSTVISRAGTALRSTGGDLVVVRPPVRHAPGSPGATLGADLGGTHSSLQLATASEQSVQTSTTRPGDEIALLRLAGVQTVRVWGDWGLVDRTSAPGRADLLARELESITAAGMSPLFILGGTLHQTAPSPEEWEAYVTACLRRYGSQVRWWEVVNEASNVWSADQYLPVLTAAHRLVKAARPTDLVIGNGATGDVGPRPLDWTKALVERGHERHLDAIAFHPYKAELDLMGQDRFKYRDLVTSLRGLLREQRPLWNTECYYLCSASRKQGLSGEEQATYGAGDLQRHYLDGLWHGVAMSTAPVHNSLTKHHRSVPANLIPNQVLAGLNALSCLLEGMATLERIEVNPLVRSGVFASADGRSGLGVVYDLRPGGSRWIVPAGGTTGIAVLDLFGNPLPAGAELRCSTDPLFLRGDPAAIAVLFRASRWQVAEPVQLSGRQIAGRLHLEAANRTGQAGQVQITFPASGLPAVACGFTGGERFTALLPPVALPAQLPWIASDGGEQVAAGSLAVTARETVLELGKPLRATLPQGTVLTITALAGHLAIAAEVPEAAPRPAPGEALYEGSALEVFIDADPGFRPDCEAMTLGSERMPVTQYIAAALPSASGRTLWSRAQRASATASAARSERTRSASGWTVRLEVPWGEIVAPGGLAPAIGLDAEIDRFGATGALVKESWGPKPGESHRSRGHYAVLVLPPEVVAGQGERALQLFAATPIADSSFTGSGAWLVQGGHPALRIADGMGFAGTRGVDIAVTPEVAASLPGRLAVFQRLPCQARSGKLAEVRFLLRTTDLRALEERLPSGYRCGFAAYLHFYDGEAKRHLNNEGLGLSKAILGTQEWTLMGFRTPIPDAATELTLSLGTMGRVSGRIQIDDVDIRYIDP